MSRHTHSSVIRVRAGIRAAVRFFSVLRRDQISLYAAQASFFVLLSGIPFLMLLLSAGREWILFSDMDIAGMIAQWIPEDFQSAFSSLAAQLLESGGLPILSATALATLWSASRGMAAVERGMCGVYGIGEDRRLLPSLMRSVVYTAILIVLLYATFFLLVFGVGIADLFLSVLPALRDPLTVLMQARGWLLLPILTAFFSLLHFAVVRRIRPPARRPWVLPGALLTAVGWMLFTRGYSLYLRLFPHAPYLYSSLALLVILMLWIHACMTLLFLGAEVNKLLTGQKGTGITSELGEIRAEQRLPARRMP